MINFIIPAKQDYFETIMCFINPIKKWLPHDCFQISEKNNKNSINVHFFREKEYKELVGFEGINVLIAHGIADKLWRDYYLVEDFDYNIVSGNLWKYKLLSQGSPSGKIIVGGYPKMDNMFISNCNNILKLEKHKKTILWAPTHNCFAGNELLSSYPNFIQYYNRLNNDGYELRISLHPANREDKHATEDELVNADIVIADSGSTIYEAWAMDKPVIFPDWLIKETITKIYPGSFEDQIFKQKIGLHAQNIDELIEMLDMDTLDEKTTEFIDGIFLKELRGNSGRKIAEFLNSINN